MISDAQREQFTARAVSMRIASDVTRREIDLADAVETLLRENAELATERDRAIAHDRQDYPTADAYGKVCAALANNKTALTFAHGRIEKLRAALRLDSLNASYALAADDALAKDQK